MPACCDMTYAYMMWYYICLMRWYYIFLHAVMLHMLTCCYITSLYMLRYYICLHAMVLHLPTCYGFTYAHMMWYYICLHAMIIHMPTCCVILPVPIWTHPFCFCSTTILAIMTFYLCLRMLLFEREQMEYLLHRQLRIQDTTMQYRVDTSLELNHRLLSQITEVLTTLHKLVLENSLACCNYGL